MIKLTTTVTIEMGDTKLELTLEEAETLYYELKKSLGKADPVIVPWTPTVPDLFQPYWTTPPVITTTSDKVEFDG